VLRLQEMVADIGYTLDEIVTPDTLLSDAYRRIDFTIRNARWERAHRAGGSMKLFASLQCTDAGSARESAREYARLGFDGVAIGEMVPRLKDIKSVLEIVATVRAEVGDEMPIHMFGVGKPELLYLVFGAGADLCDSSNYVKPAADGRSWLRNDATLGQLAATERMILTLKKLSVACQKPLTATFPPAAYGLLGSSSSN
jgi:tRNA-guanine family transglycosylase